MPVVAVEEPPLLFAVERVVRGIQIQDDLLGRSLVCLEEGIEEYLIDRVFVQLDLLVALGR